MPHISMFFGIIIRMFYNEHNPPHFHADYQGQRGIFSFEGEIIKGNFRSTTAKRLIKEWCLLHQSELQENWQNMVENKSFNKIAPLE